MKFRKKTIAKVCSLAILASAISVTNMVEAAEGCQTALIGQKTVESCLLHLKEEATDKGYVKLSSYSSRLNVREAPTTKSKVLGQLCAGDVVRIAGEEKDFYKIEFEQSFAYVYKDYVVIPVIDENEETKEKELMSAAVVTSANSGQNRNHNMALACKKINGLILEPGDQFDWYGENGVGQASKEAGYEKANIIVGGKYVKGYGGGVCQVSTALYNAVYDLGIEPDEHHHHSLESSYIENGMDATVAYPSKNFKFTNNKDYTIEIEAFTDGGQVIILLYQVTEVEQGDRN